MNTDSSIVPTKYWTRLEDGRVRCDLCPRFCKLHEGQRGLCFVRGREKDGIELYTYGRSSGFCVDPIEKKPLNHFLPGSAVLSFGTAGCNLACKFCQNWDMSKSREMDTLADSASPRELAETALEYGCDSVAFTYNDPVIFLEYAVDVARACREVDVKTVAVTAGYICPEPRKEFFEYIDAANVDLKAFTERFYKKICGAELAPVLETLEYLKNETDVWFELTTLLIPGENDSDEELREMCKWIVGHLGADVPLHFSAFHPDWKMQDTPATPPATLTRARKIAMDNGLHYVYTGNVHDSEGGSTWCPQCGADVPLHFSAFHPDWKMQDTPATPPATLTRARKIAMDNGLHYVYTGNVHDSEGGSTWCPQCGALLIERDWYQLGRWGLTAEGACAGCGLKIPGVFRSKPGTWGAKRLPVRIHRGFSAASR